jgi:hypothetical protein
MQIVQDCETQMPNTGRYKHLDLVEGIKSGLHSFKSANITHFKRKANMTTYGLAREVVTHIVDKIWMEKVISWIYDIVIRELVPMT